MEKINELMIAENFIEKIENLDPLVFHLYYLSKFRLI